MSESTVTRLRPRGQPAYTDTAALNDIHALVTCYPSGDEQDLRSDIGWILRRAGRPMIRARHIEATVTESPIGWPIAHIDAETTTVTVRQDPAGDALQVDITTRTDGERDDVTITLGGRCLHHASPPGRHPA